jgi:hypothetical protein
MALRLLVVCGGLVLLGAAAAPAQPVRVGVRLGPSFGFLNDSATPFVSSPGKTEARTNVRLDLQAGVHAIVPVGEHLAVQPELLFVQKGGHLSRVGPEVYAAERYRLSYLQAHLLGRRALPLPGPLSLHAVAGLTGAVATGGAVRRVVRRPDLERTERIPLLEQGLARRWDVGGLVGVGLGYPVGAGRALVLSLRYNPGFRPLFTSRQRPADRQAAYGVEPPPLTRTPPPLRHDVILVGLAYTWPVR